MPLVRDEPFFLARVFLVTNGADERLESEMEETRFRADREYPFDCGVLDEVGSDVAAAAAAAVAAATAVLMALGIRILKGDLVMFGAGSEVITDGSSLTGETGRLQRNGDSTEERVDLPTYFGEEADGRTVFRLSIDEEAGGTAGGTGMLVPTREREALVTRVGVEDVEVADFGG